MSFFDEINPIQTYHQNFFGRIQVTQNLKFYCLVTVLSQLTHFDWATNKDQNFFNFMQFC